MQATHPRQTAHTYTHTKFLVLLTSYKIQFRADQAKEEGERGNLLSIGIFHINDHVELLPFFYCTCFFIACLVNYVNLKICSKVDTNEAFLKVI